MSLNDIIFIDNLPTIDLHGIDRNGAIVYIKQFITENYIMKNKFIVIMHGIGNHILKQTTHNYLKTEKRVNDYKLLYNNIGCTIVELKIDKER